MALSVSLKAMRRAVLTAMLGLLAPSLSHAQTTPVSTEITLGIGGAGAIPLNGDLLYFNQYIYGAASAGGIVTLFGSATAPDAGVIFRRPATPDSSAAAYPEEILYTFAGDDGNGAQPNNGLVADASGNLYGTTRAGGVKNVGTVFKLTKPASSSMPWVLTSLYTFSGDDGVGPAAGVTLGPDGSLYGTAQYGGSYPASCAEARGCGLVFKIGPDGRFTALHVFTGNDGDGAGPASNLILDPGGVLIGTTSGPSGVTGSPAAGTLFAIQPGGAFSLVATFGQAFGQPAGHITRDRSGNVFGTLVSHPGAGAAVFEVTAVTHRPGIVATIKGETSLSGVVQDAAGNFYGTTTGLAATTEGLSHVGNGSVFEATPSGFVTILASLSPANEAPSGGVIFDGSGRLWGTSSAGGVACPSSPNLAGCGTVFVVPGAP